MTALNLTLVATTALFLGACAALTVAPRPVVASQPSLDGNKADSGVLGQLQDGGWALSPGAVGRYEGLIKLGYGKPFVPPVSSGSGYFPLPQGAYPLKMGDGKVVATPIPAGYFEMDGEHVSLFAQMILAYRAGPPP